MTKHRQSPQEERPTTLGDELRSIRETRGLTLRAVEKLTGISNAYLSQLETGKIEKPSPNYLHKLAEAYNIPYDLLMEKAGYISRSEERPRQQNLMGAALATAEDITSEEAAELMKYLAFLRSKNKRSREG